jgi:hypothetical protein
MKKITKMNEKCYPLKESIDKMIHWRENIENKSLIRMNFKKLEESLEWTNQDFILSRKIKSKSSLFHEF